MCLKTLYHNTYVDGDKDITERVDCCTPGFLCANPRIRELHRQFKVTKLQLMAGREPTYFPDPRPATPTSMSPSPGGSDTERRRRRTSGVYVNGVKVAPSAGGWSPRQHRGRDAKPRPRPVLHAPEPPAPRPIPIQRSSTMPSSSYGLETPPPERGRRPIIVEERAPTPRQVSSAGPVEILEHAPSRLRRSRRESASGGAFLAPYARVSRSPTGYASAEDEREREERRRRRRELRAQASVVAASVPTFGNTDMYGSSYGSSNGSGFGTSPPAVVDPSPAVAAVKKLRWEDEMRAEQNARIRQRPKQPRPAAAANAGLHGEVKSILKNPTAATAEEPPVDTTNRPPRIPDDDLTDLYRSVEGMSLHGRDREPSAQRRARMEQDAEEKDAAAFRERLRNRFSMPPRRYTAGSGAKRRTEIWYPDEGRYKYF